MLKAITASSTAKDGQTALNDLVCQCNHKLDIYRPNACILYSSWPHDQVQLQIILQGLNKAFPGLQIAGCTTIAGFTDQSGYKKEGCFLTMLVGNDVQISSGMLHDIPRLQEEDRVESAFRKSIGNGASPRLCIVFPSYCQVNGEKLVRQLHNALPSTCSIVGGIATDYWSNDDIDNCTDVMPPVENSLQFHLLNNESHIADNGLSYLLFSGPIEINYSYAYGWSDTGTRYPIKVSGSEILEIDGIPALLFLKENHHPLVAGKGSFIEFAFWVYENGKEPYLRDIFFNPDKNVIHTLHETLPQKSEISFSFPDQKHVMNEYDISLRNMTKENDFLLIFTCCTRITLLQNVIEQEYFCHRAQFQETPFIAGYFFGEIGPQDKANKSILHSCSSISVGLRETNKEFEKTFVGTNDFFNNTIKQQREEIESLKQQLKFFEQNLHNKKKKFSEDCLGLLLNSSLKSITGHATHLSRLFKNYYKPLGITPPYPISRNRIIDHLKKIKHRSKKIFVNAKNNSE